MPEYRVTFGSQYGGQDFGADPHPVGGYDFVHRDGWWAIVAADMHQATDLASSILGASGWSMIYEPSEYVGTWAASFPRGELLRLTHPAMATQAVHLLTGPPPPNLVERLDGDRWDDGADGRLLVTVWGNGQAEVAWREADDPHIGWGIPAALTPAPEA